jgi:hypothetical protein
MVFRKDVCLLLDRVGPPRRQREGSWKCSAGLVVYDLQGHDVDRVSLHGHALDLQCQ